MSVMIHGRGGRKAEKAARMVLLVLGARGLDVPDDVRDRITGCTDLAQLEAWATLAATAHTIQDLFGEAGGHQDPSDTRMPG